MVILFIAMLEVRWMILGFRIFMAVGVHLVKREREGAWL